MTTIADPRLQRLYDTAYDYAFQMGLKHNHGGVPHDRETFILALNERLQATEKMAAYIEQQFPYSKAVPACGCPDCSAISALAAHRRLTQTHRMACLTVVTGGLGGPCDCGVSQ